MRNFLGIFGKSITLVHPSRTSYSYLFPYILWNNFIFFFVATVGLRIRLLASPVFEGSCLPGPGSGWPIRGPGCSPQPIRDPELAILDINGWWIIVTGPRHAEQLRAGHQCHAGHHGPQPWSAPRRIRRRETLASAQKLFFSWSERNTAHRHRK